MCARAGSLFKNVGFLVRRRITIRRGIPLSTGGSPGCDRRFGALQSSDSPHIRMGDAIATLGDFPSFRPFTTSGNCVNLVTEMAIAKHSDEGVAFAADLVAGESHNASKPSIVVGLFKTHAKRVQSFLSFRLRDSAEGEDAAQDVFLKLWRQERQATLRDEATNYMYAATQSAIIDVERHRAYVEHDRVPGVDVDGVAQPQPAAEEVLHWRKALAQFVDSVKALPETTRNVFLLYHFKGLGYDEIARELGVSRRTVERHIAAGLAQCRERLKDYL